MESLLQGMTVVHAYAHALPFRVIFEEHRKRHLGSLRRCAAAVFDEDGQRVWTFGDEIDTLLDRAIHTQEGAYATLEREKNRIAAGDRREPFDHLVVACQKADAPLLKILHRLDASAVCLSGGGIRCASFSLGILEGLARFSYKSDEDALMRTLDYLSTVSGGGYMGSWMMAWVYRRRQALEALFCPSTPPDAVIHPAVLRRRGTRPMPFRDTLRQVQEEIESRLTAVKKVRLEAGSSRLLTPQDRATLSHLASEAERVLQDAYTVLADTTRRHPSPLDLLNDVQTELRGAYACCEAKNLIDRLSYLQVIQALAGKAERTSGDPEPQPVRHLRSYTSFLAPELGVTLDTFTLVAIVLRNLVVNWAMLVPVLFALLSGAEVSRYAMTWAYTDGRAKLQEHFWWTLFFLVLPFACAAVAAGRRLPSHQEQNEGGWLQGKGGVWLFLGCVVLGCLVLTVSAQHPPSPGDFLWKSSLSFAAFLGLGASVVIAYRRRSKDIQDVVTDPATPWRHPSRAAVIACIAALVAGPATGGILWLIQAYLYPRLERIATAGKPLYSLAVETGTLSIQVHGSGPPQAANMNMLILFGLPVTVGVLMITATLFCAVMGLFEMEDDREWWARCGGWFVAFGLAWISVHALVLYGHSTLSKTYAVAGLLLGGITSSLGSSGATAAAAKPFKTEQLGSLGKFLLKYDLILPVGGSAAILLILLGVVAAEQDARRAFASAAMLQGHTFLQSGLGSALGLFACSALVALLVNWGVNINIFSLHGMYRMRLMRAFLGASNTLRQPDEFTNFDWRDTPPEVDMPCGPGAPMHLLNATLNLTGTKNTAWRQRKAEGFSFSPVCCGGWRVGFVPTGMYGGTRGLTLATAMAISGAAANPNMGYQSSPVLSLLMTFFNVRLGFWLPNPARQEPKLPWLASGKAFLSKSGPSLALRPLFAEALELTDDTYRWIELSDGGHFENLALYEMVLRRVKNIVVVDGGADSKCGFEDLGNAIRKIQIDLGIPIQFGPDLRMGPGPDKKHRYCAVARIRYGCVDPKPCAWAEAKAGEWTDEQMDGHLVYIKAGLTGEEPADILQYARTHKRFPHETTGDQFFNESQFESYRHLGSFTIEQITGTDEAGDGDVSMTGFRMRAERYSNRPEKRAPVAAPPVKYSRP